MYFKRKELEKFRSFKGPLIDVRSPSEYYKGHLPNSINIPLFDNDERSIIGTIYKKEGRKKAVIEGLKFFEKKMELLLDDLFMSIDSYKTITNKKDSELFIRIYCSRGGMRSKSVAWLLEKFKLNFSSNQAILCERIPPLEQYILINNSLSFFLVIVL